jgi:drug/metabolite transporter (DMT)-like permease
MPVGVFFALAAYVAFSCNDALIKSLGTGLSPLVVGFWSALFSALPMLLTRPKTDRLSDALKATSYWRLHVRGVLIFLSSLCGIYSLTHISLAETYALIFLAPIFSTILAVIILKEEMTPGRWIGLVLGFIAVLLVVRPGFRELELGHLTAVLSATFGSILIILLRQVSLTEKRTTILAYSIVYSLALDGLFIVGFGVPFLPSLQEMLLLATAGIVGGFGGVLIVHAARTAPAAWIAPTQYSQIIWAVSLGALFFAEIPGPFTISGLVIMAIAGYFSFPSGRYRIPVGSFAFLAGPLRARRNGTRPKPDADQAD